MLQVPTTNFSALLRFLRICTPGDCKDYEESQDVFIPPLSSAKWEWRCFSWHEAWILYRWFQTCCSISPRKVWLHVESAGVYLLFFLFAMEFITLSFSPLSIRSKFTSLLCCGRAGLFLWLGLYDLLSLEVRIRLVSDFKCHSQVDFKLEHGT